MWRILLASVLMQEFNRARLLSLRTFEDCLARALTASQMRYILAL